MCAHEGVNVCGCIRCGCMRRCVRGFSVEGMGAEGGPRLGPDTDTDSSSACFMRALNLPQLWLKFCVTAGRACSVPIWLSLLPANALHPHRRVCFRLYHCESFASSKHWSPTCTPACWLGIHLCHLLVNLECFSFLYLLLLVVVPDGSTEFCHSVSFFL
jgi:hypothetical protein